MRRRVMFAAVMVLAFGAGAAKCFAGSSDWDLARDGQIIRVGWEDSDRGELQAPRALTRDESFNRAREMKAPRADGRVRRDDGVQAPQGVHGRTPCASEDQPPRWRED